jgi:hypothetical protein
MKCRLIADSFGSLRRSEPARADAHDHRAEAVSVGTDMSMEQSGIPDAIPVEMCYLGWPESLTLLAQLVQAEVPD